MQIVHDETPLSLQSIGNTKRSLLLHAKLLTARSETLTSPTLVDCGCTAYGFVDIDIAASLPRYLLPKPRVVQLANGKTAGEITEYVLTPMALGKHEEMVLLFVTRLGKANPVVLGIPWLQRHQPRIDWAGLKLWFDSNHCHSHCLPWGSPDAVSAPAPPATAPEIAPALPTPRPYQATLEDRLENANTVLSRLEDLKLPRSPSYVSPYVEDEDEPWADQEGAEQMHIEARLSPDANRYRTYAPEGTLEETRAVMIPNRPDIHPAASAKVAGQRRVRSRPRVFPPPKLAAPVQDQTEFEFEYASASRPDLTQIRMLRAMGFVQFCRDSNARAMTVTWDELDRLCDMRNSPHATEILARVSDTDVEKFMQGKPPLPPVEIVRRLPEWLRDKADAFMPELADRLPPRRAWDHKIELMPGKEPPYIKNRPLSIQELRVVRKWLEDNLSKKFIRESRARCAAPLMLAVKPGGGVRICQDYRGLNSITIKNRYPLPLIRETLDAICHAKYYTKLDIIAAFNKLRIAEGHEWKTAFSTRFGLYESLVMPFGLCNAPATFQHYINHTLHDLLDRICTAYLDDVLVYSVTRKEHREHVRTVVSRLQEAGLQIDINKCEFETTRTKYLGLIISPRGIEMDPAKVDAITSWQPPTSVRDLQRFLGFANFYRRFIRGFSAVAMPLHSLLRKKEAWVWGTEQQRAFDELRKAFTSAPTLAFFDFNRRTVLETDASNWASGGVLSQYGDDGLLRPVAYFSSKHTSAECNYEIYDKELLAIIKCLEEWRPELQGTQEPFEILTDHKNLQFFTTTKVLNQRQVRWSEFLSQFNFQITYRPGVRATRPDALSRRSEDRPQGDSADDDRIRRRERTVLPAGRFNPAVVQELSELGGDSLLVLAPISLAPDRPIDDLIDEAYAGDPLCQAMIECLQDANARGWSPAIRAETLRAAFTDCRVAAGRVYYRDRLFVPNHEGIRTVVIHRAHSSGPVGHPGRTKTVDLLNRSYWWPGMAKDVRTYVRACELCVRTKTPRTAPPGFLQPLPIPFRPWLDVSVDYITPLPECTVQGTVFKHLLVVVCRLTKMRHLIPVPTLDTQDLADAFVSRVYCLHGTPENVVSDRGTQFVSQFWRELSARLNVSLRPSSAFHPETDGQTERINSAIEQYLRAFVSFHQDDWVRWLPLAEFAGNNVVSETTGVSPFFANYGFNPQIGTEPRPPCPPVLTKAQRQEFHRAHEIGDRFSKILEQLQALARQSQQRYEDNANIKRTDAPQYQEGDLVYVDARNMKTNRPAKKLDDKWIGPYKVLKCYPRACRVELPPSVRIFPVFHTSLLQRQNPGGLPGQEAINEAEAKNVQGRVLERDDAGVEVEKWEFTDIMDAHDEAGDGQITYQVRWKHHPPTWQLAEDLKGQEEAVRQFHERFPDKPGPPPWLPPFEKAHLMPQPAQPQPGSQQVVQHRRTAGKVAADMTLQPMVSRAGRVSKAPDRLQCLEFSCGLGLFGTNSGLGGGTVTGLEKCQVR